MIGSYVCGLKSALFLHTDKNHFFLLEINNCRKTIAFFILNQFLFITPHVHALAGHYVIGDGVHIYVCGRKKILESYFSDRLTVSNIRCRTSRRIYRLALPLRTPEILSSLSKSRISIFNARLTMFVRRIMSHNSIGKYCHLVN